MQQTDNAVTSGRYIARAVGVNPAYNATDSVYRRVIPNRIDYDFAPERVPGQIAGLIVLISGTDKPSGNFYARTPGIWRLSGRIVSNPGLGSASEYLLLIDRGPDGTQWRERGYGNVIRLPGFHPSLKVEERILITEPTYFSFDARYYGSGGAPNNWTLVPGDLYAAFEIERVAEL